MPGAPGIMEAGNISKPPRVCGALACSACRLSKTKCELSDHSEECFRCSRLGLKCIFERSKRGQSNKARDVARLGAAVRVFLRDDDTSLEGLSPFSSAAQMPLASLAIGQSVSPVSASINGASATAAVSNTSTPLEAMERALHQAEMAARDLIHDAQTPCDRRALLSTMRDSWRQQLSDVWQWARDDATSREIIGCLQSDEFNQLTSADQLSMDIDSSETVPVLFTTTAPSLGAQIGPRYGKEAELRGRVSAPVPSGTAPMTEWRCPSNVPVGAAVMKDMPMPGTVAFAVPMNDPQLRQPVSSTWPSTTASMVYAQPIPAASLKSPSAREPHPLQVAMPMSFSLPPSPPETPKGSQQDVECTLEGKEAEDPARSYCNTTDDTMLPQPFDMLVSAVIIGAVGFVMCSDEEMRHAKYVAQLAALALAVVAVFMRLRGRTYSSDALVVTWAAILIAFPFGQCLMDLLMDREVLEQVMSKIMGEAAVVQAIHASGALLGGIHCFMPRSMLWRNAVWLTAATLTLLGAMMVSSVQFGNMSTLTLYYLRHYVTPFAMGFSAVAVYSGAVHKCKYRR